MMTGGTSILGNLHMDVSMETCGTIHGGYHMLDSYVAIR